MGRILPVRAREISLPPVYSFSRFLRHAGLSGLFLSICTCRTRGHHGGGVRRCVKNGRRLSLDADGHRTDWYSRRIVLPRSGRRWGTDFTSSLPLRFFHGQDSALIVPDRVFGEHMLGGISTAPIVVGTASCAPSQCGKDNHRKIMSGYHLCRVECHSAMSPVQPIRQNGGYNLDYSPAVSWSAVRLITGIRSSRAWHFIRSLVRGVMSTALPLS